MQGPRYRYRLAVEIEPVDASVVLDAFEDEPSQVRELMGVEAFESAVLEGELIFEHESEMPLEHFARDVAVLSIYLYQYISGLEVQLTPTAGAPILRAEKIVARQGETVRLPVHVGWDPEAEAVIEGEEDLAAITARWAGLPEWLRDALRLMYPRLGALP